MNAGLPERPIVIIEDSDEDFEVTVWALRQAGVANPVLRCATAAEIAGLLTDQTRWPRALVAASTGFAHLTRLGELRRS